MEIYDLLMVIVLLAATIVGAWKGMAWQLASLASLVVSYFAALRFSPLIAPHLSQQAPWNRFLAMLIVYLVTSMIIWLLFRMVADMIDRVQLKEFDRQMGTLFGAAKGVLLCVAITFFAVSLSEDSRQRVLQSRSGHYIAALLAKADAVMPAEFHQVLDPYLDPLEQKLEMPSGGAGNGEQNGPPQQPAPSRTTTGAAS